jgi:RHS repeat-associated protein
LVAGTYTYNADGQRVRRKVGGVETWQIYGMEGELLAEYAASGAVTLPQKEYGYRNGQLLISAEPAADIKWLISDHLGTPRMIIDRTGSLANVKRHDYLPFGEELLAGTGGRTLAQGYSGDNIRQKFTSKERDIETGLDYFLARYYSNIQGRFTSADSVGGSLLNPQSLNLYAYVLNNSLAYTDPTGHMADPGSFNPARCLLVGGMDCNGEPMYQSGQDPAQPPPATQPGDDYPASSNGSPMGKIADLTILGGQDSLSTLEIEFWPEWENRDNELGSFPQTYVSFSNHELPIHER